MTTTTEPRAAFVGYWRATKRDRWRPIAEGPTADACMDAALRTLADRPSGDFVVLAAGTDPNTTPRRPARRRRL